MGITSAAIAVALFSMAAGEIIPSFTCTETSSQELIDTAEVFGSWCHYNEQTQISSCSGRRESSSAHEFTVTAFEYKVNQAVPGHTDTMCVGLLNCFVIKHNYGVVPYMIYYLYFDPVLSVGTMITHNDTGSYNISLRTDIIDLLTPNTLDPFLSKEDFWNFSSPLYGIELDWFRGVRLIGFSDFPLSVMESLQNTSINHLTVSFFPLVPKKPLVLRDMPLLKTLFVDISAHLTPWSDESFFGMPKMEELTLLDNYFYTIPTIIQRLENLKKLKMTGKNCFESPSFTIPSDVFSSLKFLEDLNLDNNNIVSISGKLPLMESLKKLRLRCIHMINIEENDSAKFPALEVLDLSSNLLTKLNENTFRPLKNLKLLDLSDNKLAVWPVIYKCSLSVLDLSQNLLTYIHNLGATETTVDTLNISGNQILKWDDANIFSTKINYLSSKHLWVKIVDLSKNSISGLSESMIQSLNGVYQVDFGENNFGCHDCKMMPSLQKWLNTTSTVVTNLGTSDPLRCSSPIDQKGVPINVAQYDETPCLIQQQSLWVPLGIPLGLISLAVIIGSCLVYKFRDPISYMLHLYSIRQKSRAFAQTAYSKFAFDAFVCYSSADRRFVLTCLAPLLEKGQERYALCLHERDFPLGSRIMDNIVGTIQHSRKTIIILSQYFVSSKWCKWEMDMANHKMFNEDEHFLILIQLGKLEEQSLSHHLQYLMENRTCLEWPDAGDCEVEDACKRLKEALGPSIYQTTNQTAPSLFDIMEDY